MIFKVLILYLLGYVSISVEGFFVERFINICISKGIMLQNLQREKSTILKAKVLKSDFKKIRTIAKNTKCRVHIEKKTGIPFIINKYRKRKIFAIALGVIAIFVFAITRFVWNIEIKGNNKISEQEILKIVKEQGVKIGVLKNNLNIEQIINNIRLQEDNISWIGIKIVGTNAVIEIVEATEKPEIIDKEKITNIISDKKAIITKITVQSGTSRVKVGDEVNPGDLLVEGIMEGKYTGIRNVHSEATILGKIFYEKERKETFVQEIEERTGNEEKKIEIYIHNFKINFNKGLSKFENYDTIRTNKKIKIFSNYYIPIEVSKIKNFETKKKYKTYSEDELKSKIEKQLKEYMESEYEFSKYPIENIETEVISEKQEDGIKVKVIYSLQEEIGKSEEVVF